MPRLKLLFLFISLSPLFCVSQKKESWVDLPQNQWPQIALVNNVWFKNGDRYIDPSIRYAATGFLINNGKDTIAATAKHVLWVAKNKKTTNVLINEELAHWSMSPKGNYTDSAIIGKMINEDSSEILEGKNSSIIERDWIFFTIQRTSPAIHPLKPRYTPIKPGEKVYILSCAYADSLCTIHEGRVLRKLGMDILIDRDMTTHKGGCSGSPVIDANGYLIGIISSSSGDSQSGKSVSVAVSTEYLQQTLAGKKDLNKPRLDYGERLLNIALKQGADKAIAEYKKLVTDSKNYYVYNLRSSNRNGLRETGEKLLAMEKIKPAIEILKFNATTNSSYYVNHNVLAKAYLKAGNKEEAINAYKVSISKLNDSKENEAFQELEKLLKP